MRSACWGAALLVVKHHFLVLFAEIMVYALWGQKDETWRNHADWNDTNCPGNHDITFAKGNTSWRPVVPRRHRTSQSTIANNRLTMYAMKYDLLKHHKAYAVHAFKGCNVSHINTKIKKIEETHHNTICSPFPKHRRYPLNTPQHRDCRLHWPLPPTKAGDMHSTSYPTQQTVEWVPLSET